MPFHPTNQSRKSSIMDHCANASGKQDIREDVVHIPGAGIGKISLTDGSRIVV
jgi:hypothetical protein